MNQIDQSFMLPVSYAIRMLARRCIEHKDLMVDPVGVLANERDKMLDELEPKEWAKKAKKHTNGMAL